MLSLCKHTPHNSVHSGYHMQLTINFTHLPTSVSFSISPPNQMKHVCQLGLFSPPGAHLLPGTVQNMKIFVITNKQTHACTHTQKSFHHITKILTQYKICGNFEEVVSHLSDVCLFYMHLLEICTFVIVF